MCYIAALGMRTQPSLTYHKVVLQPLDWRQQLAQREVEDSTILTDVKALSRQKNPGSQSPVGAGKPSPSQYLPPGHGTHSVEWRSNVLLP